MKISQQKILIFCLFLGACGFDVSSPGFSPPNLCGGPEYAPISLLHRHPYLQRVTEKSAEILFTIKGNDLNPLVVGATPAQEGEPYTTRTETTLFSQQQTGLPFDYVLHKAQLKNLTPGTEYCYMLSSTTEILAQRIPFVTARPKGEQTSFIVLGDFGTASKEAWKTRAQLITELNQNPADLLITTGDNAYSSGTFLEIDTRERALLSEITASLPYYPSWGNHDYRTDQAAPSLAMFSLPQNALRTEDKERYYSFDWGDVHFVALDTETPLEHISDESDDDMADWLVQDLTSTDRRWKIIYFHRPPYSSGKHGSDLTVRDRLSPIFAAYGVDLVFSGHDHTYERSMSIEGVVYVVTGGGGRRLYNVENSDFTAVSAKEHHFVRVDVDECFLHISTISSDGDLLDSHTLSNCKS